MAQKGIQTANGKAFEYACILAVYKELYSDQKVEVEESPQLSTAKRLYENAEDNLRKSLDYAARAAVKIIKGLEPQLWNSEGNEPLYLRLQPDSAGIAGDVRDVLCIREQNGWEIGFSCKHNHHAVKHSRLSDRIDFGKEWFGIPCSKQYFEEITPLFTELRHMREESKASGAPMLWEDVEHKQERYYAPILRSFIAELKRIDAANEGKIPELLVRYLLGRYDFYKIITDDRNGTTRVEAVNSRGTLNRPSGAEKPIAKATLLKMPTRFYHISRNSSRTLCTDGRKFQSQNKKHKNIANTMFLCFYEQGMRESNSR